MSKTSEMKAKVKDFVIAAYQKDGAVPKTSAVAEVLEAPKQLVSNVISALRLGGLIPEIVRVVSSIPKGRVRGANAIVDFLKANGRLPTAQEIGVSDRVFKHALTRAKNKGEIVFTPSVPA